MSIDINYCDTLLSALSKSYTSGDYVRTFGFASVGDGGAAIYKVVSDAPAPSGVVNCTFANTSFNCGEGKFYVSGGAIFQLIPQRGKVYAEQFGVLPGAEAFAECNITMIKKAVAFATETGCGLTFAPGGVYNLNPGSISVPSGMHIDGNGATLHIIGVSKDYINLFNSKDLVDNVTVKNITLIGRKTSAESGYSDQAIHINCSNLTVQNVSFKFFKQALHTYGGDAVGEIKTETKPYTISDIPNRNWLIDSCKTESCVFGINTSEIDGLVIKDSDISCYTTSNDTAHCVYLSSNCSNVRVTGCSLCEVSGDAIHKVYSGSDKFDLSKNHFYTDLSIHNADSALDIGVISRNVMCNNVFATEVDVALQLSGADNCIVSNSYFGQHDESSKSTTFVHAQNACNCWLQNSYVKYKGSHRSASIYSPSAYVYDMFADKKHRRVYIGREFNIPNHWLKFTGCEFESNTNSYGNYFSAFYVGNFNSDVKLQFGEYCDNCSLVINTSSELFRLMAVNDLFGGITYRNCYLKNKSTSRSQPPFRFWCPYNGIPSNTICGSGICSGEQLNGCGICSDVKKYTWVRFENIVFDNFMYPIHSGWNRLLKKGKNHSDEQKCLLHKYLNAYLYNGYEFKENKFSLFAKMM